MSSQTFDLSKFLYAAKRVLRLQDWKISVKWLMPDDYEKFANPPDTNNGTPSTACTDMCDGAIDLRETDIRLVVGSCKTQREAETLLTHELLHLVLWHSGHGKERWRDTRLLEQAIVTLEGPVADGIRVQMARRASCKKDADSRRNSSLEAKAA